MTAADRPSVTDNARAEAQSRYQGDWDPYHGEPVDDFGFSDAERRAFMAGAEWAAGRAETTTALPRPGDGCQCASHTEDRGGGHYELVAEYEPACPEHSEHVWNPRTGIWEHRAETTTATTEDAAHVLDDVIQHLRKIWSTGHDEAREVIDAAEELLSQALPRLLATARTRPTRQQLIDVLREHDPDNYGGQDAAAWYYEAQADAVLALLEGGDPS